MPHRLPVASGQAGYGGKDVADGIQGLGKCDDYPKARKAMFFYAGTDDTPWTAAQSNDEV